MESLKTTRQIKAKLHQQLKLLEPYEQCALLDVTDGFRNLGSQALWLSAVLLVADFLKIKIKYTTSLRHFSDQAMSQRIGNGPIFIRGGFISDHFEGTGSKRQELIEHLVTTHLNPIIFLPQSIYFRDPANLARCAKYFNGHSALTLFTRENVSFELAKRHFSNCRIINAPDSVFHLAGLFGQDITSKNQQNILYLRRTELVPEHQVQSSTFSQGTVQTDDWISYRWQYSKAWLPGSARLYRQLWQRGMATPHEVMARLKWHLSLGRLPVYQHALEAFSATHSALYQLSQYKMVITNRLHGHIMATLLDIPNILLPDPRQHYMKATYDAWTHNLPGCRYAETERDAKIALTELLAAIDQFLLPAPQ